MGGRVGGVRRGEGFLRRSKRRQHLPKPTDRPTDRKTDIGVHREVTLPKSSKVWTAVCNSQMSGGGGLRASPFPAPPPIVINIYIIMCMYI